MAHNHNNNDHRIATLKLMQPAIVNEAEKLFNKLIKDYINKTVQDLKNKTITNVASDSESSSLSLLPRKDYLLYKTEIHKD